MKLINFFFINYIKMEFVHELKKSVKDDSSLYNQNNKTDENCYFENRQDKPIDNIYIPTSRNKDSYSKKFSSENDKILLTLDDVEVINNKTPSHYKILIDDINNKNKSSLINISDSYKTDNNEINFNKNNYSDKSFTIDDSYLLSENRYQTENSVTDNNIYKTKKFWTQQVPDTITNEYLVRDIPQYFYDQNVERFSQPKNTEGNYFNGEIQYNYTEPKVSKNYKTTYSYDNDNLVIHEGNKKSSNRQKYKKNVKYSNNDDEGMLVYYDDNRDKYYEKEFGIEKQEIRINDPNGNKYHKIRNVNSKDKSISSYEQNIMLRRNDNIVASMNYTMRYD